MNLRSTLLAVALFAGASLLSGCMTPPVRSTATVKLSPAARSALQGLVEARPAARDVKAVSNTGSMIPTMDDRYVIVVEKRPFSELTVGDIAARRQFDDVIAHRIIGRRGHWGFVTRGDGLRDTDELPLTSDNYEGVVIVAAVQKDTGEVRIMGHQARTWRRST